MKNIKKLFRSFFTGTSASDTYVLVDDGSDDLKGMPIEDLPAPSSTFETIVSPLSANHAITFKKNKTIVRATINNNSTMTADISALSAGDEALVIVNNISDLNVFIDFTTNFDMLGSTTAFSITGHNSFLLQSFIFDGTNLVVNNYPERISA